MKLTEEQILKDGNWWLITAKYPVACTAAIYRVVQDDENPVEHMSEDEWHELVDECIDSYSYLGDDFEYDDILEESEDEQYDDWYNEQKEGVEVFAQKIDKDAIDNYGINWLNAYICE